MLQANHCGQMQRMVPTSAVPHCLLPLNQNGDKMSLSVARCPKARLVRNGNDQDVPHPRETSYEPLL